MPVQHWTSPPPVHVLVGIASGLRKVVPPVQNDLWTVVGSKRQKEKTVSGVQCRQTRVIPQSVGVRHRQACAIPQPATRLECWQRLQRLIAEHRLRKLAINPLLPRFKRPSQIRRQTQAEILTQGRRDRQLKRVQQAHHRMQRKFEHLCHFRSRLRRMEEQADAMRSVWPTRIRRPVPPKMDRYSRMEMGYNKAAKDVIDWWERIKLQPRPSTLYPPSHPPMHQTPI
jgi:hypothetical protein